VIADQSANHVERFVIDEGHTVQGVKHDYGYDLTVVTYDANGYAETGLIYVQLKAAEALRESGQDYVFDLDVRDYNLWMRELLPVFFILFDAGRRKAFWIHVQRYFRQDPSLQPKPAAKTVRIRVPKRQVVGHRGVARMRRVKQELLDRLKGVVDDD
jgi:hypothetical protein